MNTKTIIKADRQRNSGGNFALLICFAYSTLHREQTCKVGVQSYFKTIQNEVWT